MRNGNSAIKERRQRGREAAAKKIHRKELSPKSFAERFEENLKKIDYDTDLTSGPVNDIWLEQKEEALAGLTPAADRGRLSSHFAARHGNRERVSVKQSNQGGYYIERSHSGGYKGTRTGAERASFTARTQEEVVERIRKSNPHAPIHLERQQNSTKGSPDKWRSA
ncbi:MAG TPA: hypothetical protein VFH95_15095 [Candidatus Kapabacteria bacterium]|nr:hypothetical protein [Candidatus Kapabacteria bacterium]